LPLNISFFHFYCCICFVGARSLAEACLEGDVGAVKKLLEEGWSVHEPTDEGESLLSLACSAGWKQYSNYYNDRERVICLYQ
jgi:ankyrin repeat protein